MLHKPRYVLGRELGVWRVTFEGRPGMFKHEKGALYIACLLLEPPPEPLHGLELDLKARKRAGEAVDETELVQQRNLGLDEAQGIGELRRKARQLEAVLDDPLQSPVAKSDARQQLEDIAQFLRQSSWRTQDYAQKCVRAVARAIQRLHDHLAAAVDTQGRPHPVLRPFARHVHRYLLVPSGRGGRPGGPRPLSVPGGCFTYEPPPGVVWVEREN